MSQMLASVDDPADGHVWKGPGGSDDPTLVMGQKVLRVSTTEDWCYVTTKKEEIYRIEVDGKGDWEKVPGWPIPLSIKIRYPDGGAERTLEFENKDVSGRLLRSFSAAHKQSTSCL